MNTNMNKCFYEVEYPYICSPWSDKDPCIVIHESWQRQPRQIRFKHELIYDIDIVNKHNYYKVMYSIWKITWCALVLFAHKSGQGYIVDYWMELKVKLPSVWLVNRSDTALPHVVKSSNFPTIVIQRSQMSIWTKLSTNPHSCFKNKHSALFAQPMKCALHIHIFG